jgi:hypothetical protein
MEKKGITSTRGRARKGELGRASPMQRNYWLVTCKHQGQKQSNERKSEWRRWGVGLGLQGRHRMEFL